MNNSSIEIITSIYPHNNADKLELVKVLGYQCIVPKGIYKEGDKILFIKPDSVLPKDKEWAELYLKYSPKRIKAIRIRGEWSEGLIVPLLTLLDFSYTENDNMDEILDIKHFEPPIPNNLQAKSNDLPYNIPKTDEERFENIKYLPYGEIVDVTLKVDGQSCSYYYNVETDSFGVLSRGMELKEECSNKYTNHINNTFNKDLFIDYCKKNNVSLCIRGESYGLGIQSMKINPHSSQSNGIAFFSIYNISKRKYENKGDQYYYLNVCNELNFPVVTTIEENVILTPELIKKYSIDLEQLDNKYFEGVVIKYSKGSFKVINKTYDSLK